MVTHPETGITAAGTLSYFGDMFCSQIFVIHWAEIKSYTSTGGKPTETPLKVLWLYGFVFLLAVVFWEVLSTLGGGT